LLSEEIKLDPPDTHEAGLNNVTAPEQTYIVHQYAFPVRSLNGLREDAVTAPATCDGYIRNQPTGGRIGKCLLDCQAVRQRTNSVGEMNLLTIVGEAKAECIQEGRMQAGFIVVALAMQLKSPLDARSLTLLASSVRAPPKKFFIRLALHAYKGFKV
jgi:hypothetical protein